MELPRRRKSATRPGQPSSLSSSAASTHLRVRAARPGDLDILIQFNQALARETEGRALDPRRLRPGVRRLLQTKRDGFYVVAEVREGRSLRVVGQACVTFEWSDWRNGRFWWFQSVYVDPAYRRQGIFRALHRHLRERATRTPGICGLRLYVEHENRVAQSVYAGLGMKPAGYHVLEEDFTQLVAGSSPKTRPR